MYQGGFERNFPVLKSGATTFQGTDGAEHKVADAPPKVDGVCFGYMEKAGKKFAAVRAQFGKDDVVVKNEVLLDPGRHLGFGNRLSPEPTLLEDEFAAVLLEDMMAKNPEQRRELAQIRSKFSVTGKAAGQGKAKS
jgi:hypothetical protein